MYKYTFTIDDIKVIVYGDDVQSAIVKAKDLVVGKPILEEIEEVYVNID